MKDEINKKLLSRRKTHHFFKFKQFSFSIRIILLTLLAIIKTEKLKYLFNFSSQIYLVLINNDKNIINNFFDLEASKVLVNGIKIENHKNIKSRNLENEENKVTLYFNDPLTSCEKMFYQATNLKEIDLSKFDFSEVTTMSQMFMGCNNLERINFGNINTSSVTNMKQCFLYAGI